MSTTAEEPVSTGLPSGLVPGKKYRFFARSAEEAVQIIHDRMGPKARVVAVEQAGGHGLGRLLRGTRLEVIAVIPEAAVAPAPAPRAETPASEHPKVSSSPARSRPRPQRPASMAHAIPEPPPAEIPTEDEAPRPAEAAAVGPTYTPSGRRVTPEEVEVRHARRGPVADDPPVLRENRDLRAILTRLGFSPELLADFAQEVTPQELGRGPWTDKIDRFVEFLWGRYRQLPSRPLTQQVAFFGTPGSGITTSLCKELTASVFLRGEQPLVSSLEIDRPSSTEGLRAFCELMQVPLVPEERGAMTPAERVFWDIPGIPSRDFDTWDEVGGRLDELLIQTRVFVIHAAFDTQHLLQLLRTVEAVRPTHLVLSHLDEATQPARLWGFLEAAGLCPLFAGENASVTGGRRDDFHAALLAQIFPTHLNPKTA